MRLGSSVCKSAWYTFVRCVQKYPERNDGVYGRHALFSNRFRSVQSLPPLLVKSKFYLQLIGVEEEEEEFTSVDGTSSST